MNRKKTSLFKHLLMAFGKYINTFVLILLMSLSYLCYFSASIRKSIYYYRYIVFTLFRYIYKIYHKAVFDIYFYIMIIYIHESSVPPLLAVDIIYQSKLVPKRFFGIHSLCFDLKTKTNTMHEDSIREKIIFVTSAKD